MTRRVGAVITFGAVITVGAMLVGCGSGPVATTSITHTTATTAPLSITSPTYALLGRVASEASGVSNAISSVTLPYECAARPSSQCQVTLPDTMQEQFTQLQQDVSSLESSGALSAYSGDALVASDLRNVQDDMNQLSAPLGQEIEGLETDNPDEIRMGAQAQNELAGIGNAALAIRNDLTTS